MPLPDLIEIVPLGKAVWAEITVPGSKSITNRALVLATLADGQTKLPGALWSEDTQIMVECLRRLGFEVAVEPDPEEFCNRTITVNGLGGRIPRGGTAAQPLELFVGNAGTAARFLAALVCLGDGVYRLHGTPRMHERPQAALLQALRELGYRVETDNQNDRLPAKIFGGGTSEIRSPRSEETPKSEISNLQSEIDPNRLASGAAAENPPRSCTVSIEESSQFASALLLCASAGGWNVKITGENAEESPYVALTTKMIEAFPPGGGTFQIEPDASSGSYFWAAGNHLGHSFTVTVANWPNSGWQPDQGFHVVLHVLHGAFNSPGGYGAFGNQSPRGFSFPAGISRQKHLGDSVMTAIVLASLLAREQIKFLGVDALRFTDLGRLRVQECERVTALRTELTRCGAKVVEEGDTLTVFPSADHMHGAEIETYHDHRMAMCFAILGLKVPGIKIKNPACVKKTFPNFFQKLAAPPPRGLGATIRDAATGRQLTHDELFAD
ncbi:MAG: 3-phosphoshikimate 1-carboxyvinyltransferase [Verrucomicrobia bacterium]|nr:3-phosphoshikimate 1-carboxyvinyltransferase [Verrucomicrobiota bacterium]